MTALLPRRRRRLEFLPCSRWRLPAWLRMTLPVPVILNRFATDFFVLMPLGRRINLLIQLQKGAHYTQRRQPTQARFSTPGLVRLEFGAKPNKSGQYYLP